MLNVTKTTTTLNAKVNRRLVDHGAGFGGAGVGGGEVMYQMSEDVPSRTGS